MTPPRHDKTPPIDPLTDTGERKAIVDEVVGKIRDEITGGIEMARSTPTPHETTEMAQRALAYQLCETEPAGPACKLSKRMDGIEERIDAMELARATEKAADEAVAKLAAKMAANRTVLISAAIGAASLAANVLFGIWKARHGG